MNSIPSMDEIHKLEAEALKKFCEEHFGSDACNHCHSSTAQGWCKNHPKYGVKDEPN